MKTRARGIRLSESLAEEVRREQERTGKNWSQTVEDLLEEAVKMRRAPGVAFRSGPTGRRATLPGTGIDVWEVVAAYQAADEDWERLVEEFPELEPMELRAALSYWEMYPEEIEDRIERERELTAENLYQRHPFTRPAGPS